MVQGAVPHFATVRAREAARTRAHGERSATRRARAACESPPAARRAVGPRPRQLVSNTLLKPNVQKTNRLKTVLFVLYLQNQLKI